MRALTIRHCVASAAAILTLGCGGDSPTGPNASWQGTWRLQTVNGESLPTTIGYIGWDVHIVARSLTLTSDAGTYIDASTSSLWCPLPDPSDPPCNSSESATVASWDVGGDNLTVNLNPDPYGNSRTLHFTRQADGTLVETDENLSETYRKE